MAAEVAEDAAVDMVAAEVLAAKAGQMIVLRLANRVLSVKKKVVADTDLEEDLRAAVVVALKEERNINLSILV